MNDASNVVEFVQPVASSFTALNRNSRIEIKDLKVEVTLYAAVDQSIPGASKSTIWCRVPPNWCDGTTVLVEPDQSAFVDLGMCPGTNISIIKNQRVPLCALSWVSNSVYLAKGIK